MRVEPRHGPPTPWHVMYLSVTALGIGVLVGVQHQFPRVPDHLELAVLGVLVGMFTVTSLLHWYDVTRTRSAPRLPKKG